MTLCPFLCSNEINARKRCRLLSSWNCSNVFEKSANIFGNVRKSSESCRKSSEVAGAFLRILVTTRCKSHAFDSENLTHLTPVYTIPDNFSCRHEKLSIHLM